MMLIGSKSDFLSVNIERSVVCLILFICFAHGLMAHEDERPKVGLVLSGGGAKGVAHIGVLKVLEKADIPIDYICGTSMGAIIGGLYSVGYSASEIDSMVRAQDWIPLLTDQIARPYSSFHTKYNRERFLVNIPLGKDKIISTPSGIVRGQGILNKFTELTTGYHQVESFDDLPIPFACVAGDLMGGKEVVIKGGNLPLAMRTSMAVPGVFEPIYHDGMVLVDGGIFNNFPVDVVKEMGADITIGVDLSTEAFVQHDYKELISIANRITFLLGEEKYRKNKEDVDLYMNPGLKGYTSADFKSSAIDTMIVMGERVAREHWNDIIALKNKLGCSVKKKSIVCRRSVEDMNIKYIRFDGLETFEEKDLLKMLKIGNKPSFSLSEVENIVWSLQGLGIFDQVSYSIVEDGEGCKNTLVVSVHEKNKGNIGIGVHLDTEEIASVLLQAQGIVGERKKHNIVATAKINKNAWLNLDYSFRIRNMNRLGFSYQISYKDFVLKNCGKEKKYLSYLNNHVEIYMKNDSYRRFSYKGGIQCNWFNNASQWYSSQDYIPYREKDNCFLSGFIDVIYDSFDDKEIPTRGLNICVVPELYVFDLSENSSHMFSPFTFRVKGACRVNDNICVLPEFFGRFVFGDKIPGYYANYIGGECYDRYMFGQQSFYGIHNTELIGSKTVGGRIDLRYRLAEKHYLSCVGNYLIYHDKIKSLFKGESLWGAGFKYTYNSFLGPVSATIDYSDRTNSIGFYASLGYCF